MSYIFYIPNPRGRFVGDCVIRAVCRVTHQGWRTVHADLADLSDEMCNNMCADEVTGSYSLCPGFKYEYSGHMPEHMPDYSYRRGRSMTTGRYVSRGDHYSGHSIYDILVANMELTYNDCKSEHDEKIIDTAIRMVNQNR